MSYPIKKELDKAHGLLCRAAFFLVFQITTKRYRPADARIALEKAEKAVEILKNLIDHTTPKG